MVPLPWRFLSRLLFCRIFRTQLGIFGMKHNLDFFSRRSSIAWRPEIYVICTRWRHSLSAVFRFRVCRIPGWDGYIRRRKYHNARDCTGSVVIVFCVCHHLLFEPFSWWHGHIWSLICWYCMEFWKIEKYLRIILFIRANHCSTPGRFSV